MASVRTDIVIEDILMEEAMAASGQRSKRATVEEGLRLLIQFKGQEANLSLAGQVEWVGDLEASREGRARS